MIIAPATSFKSRIKRIAELSTTVPNKMFERATDPNVLTSEELVNFFSSDPEICSLLPRVTVTSFSFIASKS